MDLTERRLIQERIRYRRDRIEALKVEILANIEHREWGALVINAQEIQKHVEVFNTLNNLVMVLEELPE